MHILLPDIFFANIYMLGRVAPSVVRLTHESEVLGSIRGPVTYCRFSFR